MPQRDRSGQPAKGRHVSRPKPRKVPTAAQSIADLQTQLGMLARELKEAQEQQSATTEVLQVINSSPGELAPVFDAMLEKALSLCKASYGVLCTYDGDSFRAAALRGVPARYAEFLRSGPLRPGPGNGLSRLVAGERVVHVLDVAAEGTYRSGEAMRRALVDLGGARTTVTVPLLKDNKLFGAFIIFRQDVRPFTEKQIALAQNFAAQAVIAIENARLLTETREALERQTATAEVLQVINSSPANLAPVFETILEKAHSFCGVSHGSLQLYDGEKFRAVAAHGIREAFADQLRQGFMPGPNHPSQQLLKGARFAQVPDCAEIDDPIVRAAFEISGIRTVLLIPLRKEGSLVGQIAAARRDVRPFTEKEIALLENFAAQAVIAMENARLFEQVQAKTRDLEESLEQQIATAGVLEVISRSAFDLQTVFNTVAESAVRLCGADRAFIFRFDGELLRMVVAYNASAEFTEFVRQNPIRPGRHSGSARAALERRTVQIVDVRDDAEYSYGAKQVEAIRTLLGVPILKGDELFGVMMIYRLEVRPFTERQIALVETFANQAAIAIENVRLFEAEQRRTIELAKSLDELRTTQDRLVQTEKLASLGQLTAGIAHEIKNPLNFVNNFSTLSVELIDELNVELSAIGLDDKAREQIDELTQTLKGNLERVVQHGKRADSIIRNMLLHSREGSGEHRPTDINAMVEESLNLAYHGARAEKSGFNVTLKRSLDPDAGMADLYPQEITRVLLNLISNGFYAATKRKEAGKDDFEPTLSASTRSLGNQVEIRIRDNGTGIPPEVREKIFNPFFTTKPAGEGTGLGLSMSHDIVVKQHGGKIDLDTKPGAFTEFIITLPRNFAAQPIAGGGI